MTIEPGAAFAFSQSPGDRQPQRRQQQRVFARKHALREGEPLGAVCAHDLMVPVGTTLPGSERLHRAAETLARSDFERLPVIGEDGRFRGLLAKRDLLAVYAQEVSA